jgi:hypothetical protein
MGSRSAAGFGGDRWLKAAVVAVPLLGLAHVLVGAISPPSFSAGDSVSLLRSAGWIARILLTTTAAVAVLLGPGLILRPRIGAKSPGSLAFVWVPGLLYLTLAGVAAWLLAPGIDPALTSAVALGPLLAGLAWATARAPFRVWFRPGELAVCGLTLVVLAIGVGKATWSQGPVRELYGGKVSRTLEAGDRPDSRIQFHVVQLVAHGADPYGRMAGRLFFPFTFSDRGPLAGLAAAPIVLSSGAKPPVGLPNQPWVPFDQQGFAAYRIVLELLGATILLSTYGLVRSFASSRAAWAATALIALTPFVVHEVYFTWPKLLAASLGVAALAALVGRRPGVAGALLGLSYLAHPVGLFITFAVGGTWFALSWWGPGPGYSLPGFAGGRSRLEPAVRGAAWLVAGLGGALLVWRLANGSHFAQSNFLSYLTRSYGQSGWLGSRGISLANTLVPFRLFVVDHASPSVNPLGDTHAPLVIPFFYQYWNTLPFAVGIVYFPVFLVGLWRFARRHLPVMLLGVVTPFVVFAVYWGNFNSGLMREGLQGWVVLALIAAFIGHTLVAGRPHVLPGLVRVCTTLRAIELLAMLAIPTIATSGLLGRSPFILTDVVSLATMLAGVAGLALISWRAFDPQRGGEAIRSTGRIEGERTS